MTAGELALVVGAVLCALTFAAFALTLVRVRDLVTELRRDVADLRETSERAAAETARALADARDDLDRFDKVVGSAEAISGVVGRSSRVTRAALSTPAIKAAGIATGTTRAVRKLRSGT